MTWLPEGRRRGRPKMKWGKGSGKSDEAEEFNI
jgi:hypothetical protein